MTQFPSGPAEYLMDAHAVSQYVSLAFKSVRLAFSSVWKESILIELEGDFVSKGDDQCKSYATETELCNYIVKCLS